MTQVLVRPQKVATRSIRTTGTVARSMLLLNQCLLGLALVAIWWLFSVSGSLSADVLPSPGKVAESMFDLAATPDFWAALSFTLSNALLGLVLGCLVAVPLGLLLGLWPALERTTRLLADFGRSFPVIALLPVMILILGATPRMEVTVVFLGVVWPVLLQTIYGSRRIDPVVRDTVRAFQIPLWLRFSRVLLPAAAPFTATGIRVAASASILLAVAVEVLGKTPGIGFELVNAQSDGRPEIAFAYIAYSGLLGVLLNFALSAVEEKLLGWNSRGDKKVAR